MNRIIAYIDESGDPRFNEGASSRIEFSAILIDALEENVIIQQLNSIQRELDIAEFKSSKIKSEKRRIQILKSIQIVNFKFINLTIDKSKVIGEWKNYPRVFYKYTQRILHNELYRLYPNQTVTIDKFGNEQYQQSLKQYLEQKTQLEIFDNIVNIGSARDNLLIQLADLIAGTNRKLSLGDFENPELVSKLLQTKELHLIKWPENFQQLVFESISNEQDRFVAEISVSYAENYIKRYNGDPDRKHRIAVLEYLLFQVKFTNYKQYVYSNELITWLEQNYMTYSEEDFRREIIGQLRDEGVVIAGSRKGLKIPMSLEELVDYLNYTASRYLTMIKRFKETYKTLNASALGNIDIFNSKEFEIHKEIFKVLDKY